MARIVRPSAVSFAKGGKAARLDGNRARPVGADQSSLWLSRGQQHILERLRGAVLAGTGVLFLTGDVGTGKTFLARTLLHRLRADAIVAAPMYARDDPRDFWREVAEGWGIRGAPDTLEAVHDGLAALLDGAEAGNRRVLLVIDEAQRLRRDMLGVFGMMSVM
jgi:type II secretory pathway predicted ATPase ExeA